MQRNLDHPERYERAHSTDSAAVPRSPFDFATREEYRQWKGRKKEDSSKRRGSVDGKTKKMGLIDRAVADGFDRFNRPHKYEKNKQHPPIKQEQKKKRTLPNWKVLVHCHAHV